MEPYALMSLVPTPPSTWLGLGFGGKFDLGWGYGLGDTGRFRTATGRAWVIVRLIMQQRTRRIEMH